MSKDHLLVDGKDIIEVGHKFYMKDVPEEVQRMIAYGIEGSMNAMLKNVKVWARYKEYEGYNAIVIGCVAHKDDLNKPNE